MELYILGGFLGSGKTTLLMSLARYLAAHYGADHTCPVAVIENEIGEVAVDQKLLEQTRLPAKTLYSGCICCAMAGDLIPGIEELAKQYAPGHVLLEASGLAVPQRIASAVGQDSRCVARCACIVVCDASRWLRCKDALQTLSVSQLRGADAVIVTKCDLVDEESLVRVRQSLRELGVQCPVYETAQSHEHIWQELIPRLKNR